MELITILEKFVNIYERNQIPVFITILSTIIPIILSIVVIVQNCIISKRNEELQKKISIDNEKLQKDIYNNEVKIKTYDIILNVYITFTNALSKLPISEDGLKAMLEKRVKNNELIYALIKERDKITLESGKLKLLLKDDEILTEKIFVLKEKYKYIANEIVNHYVKDKKIEINEILKNIQEYQELLEYDNYDKYFEKYLSFKEL